MFNLSPAGQSSARDIFKFPETQTDTTQSVSLRLRPIESLLIESFRSLSLPPPLVVLIDEFEAFIQSHDYLVGTSGDRAALFAHLIVHLIEPAYIILSEDRDIVRLTEIENSIHRTIAESGIDPTSFLTRYREKLEKKKKKNEKKADKQEKIAIIKQTFHNLRSETLQNTEREGIVLQGRIRELKNILGQLGKKIRSDNYALNDLLEAITERANCLAVSINRTTSQMNAASDAIEAEERCFHEILDDIVSILSQIK